MTTSSRLFTSESVTEGGHPDKICDAISDSILDAILTDDPNARVAVETLVTTGQVHVAGEVTTTAYADIPGIVRAKILEIGYDSSTKASTARRAASTSRSALSRRTSPAASSTPTRAAAVSPRTRSTARRR